MDNRYFPLFINPEGKKIVVFGGGNIATRRIKTLMDFNFEILVVARSISDQLNELVCNNKIKYIEDEYKETYLDGSYMVLACTDNREVNMAIGNSSKNMGLPVSVCDCREECTFFFPAIAINDEVTVGITGSGHTHHITRRAAGKIREIIKGKAY